MNSGPWIGGVTGKGGSPARIAKAQMQAGKRSLLLPVWLSTAAGYVAQRSDAANIGQEIGTTGTRLSPARNASQLHLVREALGGAWCLTQFGRTTKLNMRMRK
eukprot:862431-Karenia_brevis.AAC.1